MHETVHGGKANKVLVVGGIDVCLVAVALGLCEDLGTWRAFKEVRERDREMEVACPLMAFSNCSSALDRGKE